MKWASAVAEPREPGKFNAAELFADCCAKLQTTIEKPDLALVFVSSQFQEEFHEIPDLSREFLQAKTLIGCSASGVIGGGIEIEQQPSIAIAAAELPGVEIQPFHIKDEELPDLDAPQGKWEELIGVAGDKTPAFVLLPDPFTFRIDVLAQGLDFAFPKCVKLGGLASGAHRVGMNALFLNNRVYRSGAVGVALSGDLVVDTIVAQGCRPVGWPLRVTKCDRNFLFELDGKSAVHALYEVLEGMSEKEQKLAQNSLMLGVVMNEFKDTFEHGDFLIRNILGLEPNTGALLVGESLHNERTIQFHVRDTETSAEDLRALLKRYRDSHAAPVSGALLFSCVGRGQTLYGIPHHDSLCFLEYLGGAVPLTGFFCSGEIGPVGGTTFLHGYTSSFGLFRPK
jgi:small ligand-binding sensory domain FIST